MRHTTAALILAVALAAAAARMQAADSYIERLALCQDSWFEGKDDPAQTKLLADSFNAAFAQKAGRNGESTWMPTSAVSVAGMRVSQAFPESVGMGVGFSVMVDAPFETARQRLESASGKTLECETGDGTRGCSVELAENRTLMLMSPEDPNSSTSLVGCYYFYQH